MSIAGSTARTLEELSEEELLAFELAEEDLDLEEDEEEEWRQYDEEVRCIREIMAVTDSGFAASSSSSAPAVTHSSSSSSSSFGNREALAAMRAAVAISKGVEMAEEGGERREAEAGDDALEEQLRSLLGEAGASASQAQLRLLLTEALERGRAQAESTAEEAAEPAAEEPAAVAAVAPWAPGAQSLVPSGARGYELPAEYRQRLSEGEGGVVVSGSLGPNTVVLLSRVPDQPELLPVLSETFRAQRVRILRGWLETSDNAVMDAFEVCDAKTGAALTREGACKLEGALVQAMRAPGARRVIFEIDDQLPRLDAFFGLPAGGSRPPPLAAARGALVGGPFQVFEADDLGRALAFRGELDDTVDASWAVAECQHRLWKIGPEYSGEWECLLVKGPSGLLLLVVPVRDMQEALKTSFNDQLVSLFAAGITAIYSSSSVLSPPGPDPSVGALVLGVVGCTEIARRLTADKYGVRLSLPILLPSPAIGTFGTCVRATSVVPNATVLFDMASAATTTALLVSFGLIAFGLLMKPAEPHCVWVNPGILPSLLKGLVRMQAESYWSICKEPPAIAGAGSLVPASSVLIGGCFGALMAAFNALPLGRLDGTSIVAATPLPRARETLLPRAAFLLGLAVFAAESDSYFPLVLAFFVFTFGVRPQLTPEPVLRDNLSQPRDFQRQGTAFVLLFLSFLVLMPSAVLDASSFASGSLWL